MAEGIQIFNEDNTLQIDGVYKNYHLVEKRTVTINGSGGDFGSSATISVTGNFPLIGFAPSVLTAISNRRKNGSTYKFKISIASNSTQTFDVYIFDILTTIPSSTFGLQVFNPSGDIVFDAMKASFRVVDSITAGSPVSVTKNYTFPIIVVPVSLRSDASEYSGIDNDYYLKYDCCKVTNNQQTLSLNYAKFDIVPNTANKVVGQRNYLIVNSSGLS